MSDSRNERVSEAEIGEALDRIVESRVFARSHRIQRFLTHVVDHTQKGETASLKEYAIALSVYDKPPSFDPRIDPIIRVEASRLRSKLREYYDEEGRDDPVRIDLKTKGYEAVIRKRSQPDGGRVIPSQSSPSVPCGTANPEAHHYYLKGLYYWNKRTADAVAGALGCFQRAIALDPQYALAYSGLADCYVLQAWLESHAPAELWPLAEAAANDARSRDKSLAQPLATLAFIKAVGKREWNEAESLFRQAIELDPDYATARHWYGTFCLAPQRRLNAALVEVGKAFEADPISPIIGVHVGQILYFRRQYADALDQYARTLELDPGFHQAYWQIAFTYVQQGRFDDAIQTVESALSLDHNSVVKWTMLGFVNGFSGRRGAARRALRQLEEYSAQHYVSPVNFALIHTAIGNLAAALNALTDANAGGASRVIHLKVDPAFDRLKTDPRFASLLAGMNLL
jgi:tetratricopeptide (TPR) repeat protein